MDTHLSDVPQRAFMRSQAFVLWFSFSMRLAYILSKLDWTSDTVCWARLVMGTQGNPMYSSIWHSNLSKSSNRAGSIFIWVDSTTGRVFSPRALTNMAGLSSAMARKKFLALRRLSSVTLNTNGHLAISWSWFMVSVLSTSSSTIFSMYPESFPPKRSLRMTTELVRSRRVFLMRSISGLYVPFGESVYPTGTGCHEAIFPYMFTPSA